MRKHWNIVSFLGLMLTGFFVQTCMAEEKPRARDTLMNVSFESARGEKPEYWEFSGPNGRFIWDSQSYYEGKHSAQIFLQGPGTDSSRLRQSVSVEAGKRYDLGGMIKTELDNGYAQLMVVFLNNKGEKIKTFFLPKISQKQNWVFQGMWIKSPNRSDVAYITCFVHGKGKAWFDNIRFSTKLLGGY